MVAPRENICPAFKKQIRLCSVKTASVAGIFGIDYHKVSPLRIFYPAEIFTNKFTSGSSENIPHRKYFYQFSFSVLTRKMGNFIFVAFCGKG